MSLITEINNNPFETFSREYNVSPQNQIQFYTYGDSHSFCATETLFKPMVGNVKWHSNWLGPKLMYSVGRDGTSLLNINRHEIPPKNSVHMFSFGAIDINYIFRKRTLLNVELEEVTIMVKNYEKVLLENYRNDIHFWILGILPPTQRENNAVYLTHKMNLLLQEMAKRNSFFYIDTFDLYHNSKGILREEISDTLHHIGEYYPETVVQVAKEFERIRIL